MSRKNVRRMVLVVTTAAVALIPHAALAADSWMK